MNMPIWTVGVEKTGRSNEYELLGFMLFSTLAFQLFKLTRTEQAQEPSWIGVL